MEKVTRRYCHCRYLEIILLNDVYHVFFNHFYSFLFTTCCNIEGLGWVAVTGSGHCRVRVTVPTGTNVGLRPSLMPFEAAHSTAKFTGGRISKKSKRPGAQKGYGWRA